jgi:hypothetical protein
MGFPVTMRPAMKWGRGTSVGKTENRTLAQQIHHPDRGEDCVGVVKPVNNHVPLVWPKTKRKVIVTRADRCQQLALVENADWPRAPQTTAAPRIRVYDNCVF